MKKQCRKEGRKTRLCALFMAQFLMILNVGIVAVALPSIQRDLSFSTDGLTWVVNAYIIAAGGFLVVGGKSADLFGRERVLNVGIALFSMASLVCGAAQTEATMIIGRACQGLGAAAVVPATLSILTTSSTTDVERRRVLGMWAGVNAIAGGVALVLGGALVEFFSWRAIFVTNVAIGAVVLATAAVCMSDSGKVTGVRIDLSGATALTFGMTALVYVMINVRQNGWLTTTTMAALALAILSLGAFVTIERTRNSPLIRLSLLQMRTVITANLVISVVTGVVTSILYLMALYFQQILGASSLWTGSAFLPATAVVIVSVLMTNRLIMRLGLRNVLLTSLSLVGIGAALFTRISVVGDYAKEVLPAMVVMYLGAGSAGVALVILATANVPKRDAGVASGMVSTSERLGAAFWLALFVMIVDVRTSTTVAHEWDEAFVGGVRDVFWTVSILAALIVVAVAAALHHGRGPVEDKTST